MVGSVYTADEVKLLFHQQSGTVAQKKIFIYSLDNERHQQITGSE